MAAINGNDVWQGITQGAISGAISGAMFYGAGQVIAGCNITNASGVVIGNTLSAIEQAGVHAVAGAFSGAVNAAITGGNVGQGALIGGLSAGMAKYMGGKTPARIATGALTGGVSSVLAGGDFAEGAIQGAWTSAIAYKCNDLMHDLHEGIEEAWLAVKASPNDAWDAVVNEETGAALLEAGEIVVKTKAFVGAKALAIYGAANPGVLAGRIGQFSDWYRTGTTIVSRQLIEGLGAKGAVATWGIKGGGINRATGFKLPFHYHIHKYNWYKPGMWFKQTPILK